MKKIIFILFTVLLSGAGCGVSTINTNSLDASLIASIKSMEITDSPQQTQQETDTAVDTLVVVKPTSTTDLIEEERIDSFFVTRVIDGDTIDVMMDGKTERIRLIGIDTPETVDPRKSVQCFGKEASEKTTELLLNKYVILEADASQGDKDIYGRLLRYPFLDDGQNVGLTLISDGFAHEYTYNTPYKYQKDFKSAELAAREGKKGLWADNACAEAQTSIDSSVIIIEVQTPTVSPAAEIVETPPSPNPPTAEIVDPAVKKSTTGKCHAKGTQYYNQTKKFTAYDTIVECLDSGGVLPL
ncbi:MAG: hypothetical protein COU35_04745 [Candidatus Magasanikbacteria bacterium CG10_big_fil_rev_8_21_14_0_10_47_10]|uniref:TNase-like domain-containing protein n=1 Tax=Candidatus Magasanikbacteria bacterium CG10_big_fil_rev_8_21_14_0_10_47_10 TaxID=1974652 RepID=A0A2H0TPF8_9BACT|nr:MAG: hypothetical protein COU35_04745 [Candidatus Magasanikbacteria bacterium CG10_big_fil_rev_8_21_14_0_10_47_10]